VLDLKSKTRSLIPNVTLVETFFLAAHSSARGTVFVWTLDEQ
jgi:hypothetical protein